MVQRKHSQTNMVFGYLSTNGMTMPTKNAWQHFEGYD